MHTLNFDPRQRLLMGVVALAAALLIALAVAAPLGSIDLSSGGSGSAATSAAPPQTSSPTTEQTPAWVADPLASPLNVFKTAGR